MIQTTCCPGAPLSVALTTCYSRSFPFKTLSAREFGSHTPSKGPRIGRLPLLLAKYLSEEKESGSQRLTQTLLYKKLSTKSTSTLKSFHSNCPMKSCGVEKLTTLVPQMSGRATKPLNCVSGTHQQKERQDTTPIWIVN